jgi:hypothetical protein
MTHDSRRPTQTHSTIREICVSRGTDPVPGTSVRTYTHEDNNKKFWEELITYFP